MRLAAGRRLEGDPPPVVGHAIEARLNAEDSDRASRPAPGTIELLRFPGGPGLRIDTGFEEGDVVPSEFDSMIAKVIAHGRTRDEASARLGRALRTPRCSSGGTSNRAFLQQLVGRTGVRAGGWTWAGSTDWWRGRARPASNAEWPSCALPSSPMRRTRTLERSQFLATAVRGRPEVRLGSGTRRAPPPGARPTGCRAALGRGPIASTSMGARSTWASSGWRPRASGAA